MIEIKQVSKKYKDTYVNKDISLKINTGDFIALMGPSGSGKTTFLNIMAGLTKPTKGKILIAQKNITNLKEPRLTKWRRKQISFIYQEYLLIDYLNVYDNLIYTAKVNHLRINKKMVSQISEDLGIRKLWSKKINKLSGGQKQRVAIGRALVNKSPIILADEPTGALDLINRQEIIKLLQKAALKYQTTIFCVTHDPFVASAADKVYFLTDGIISNPFSNLNETQIAQKLSELEVKHAQV